MDTSHIKFNIPRGSEKWDPTFMQIFIEREQRKEYERRKALLHSRSSFLTHGFMIYECENCGNIYLMWLEKGLEERLHIPKKPTPFIITCPYCMGPAKDKTGNTYCNKTEDLPLKIDSTLNCFINDPDTEYGLAIIQKADGKAGDDLREIIYYKGLSAIYNFNTIPLKEKYEKEVAEWISSLGELLDKLNKNGDMIFENANRQERRHPEKYYETKYKRPRKGEKPWQK